jgi:hypothetical protein
MLNACSGDLVSSLDALLCVILNGIGSCYPDYPVNLKRRRSERQMDSGCRERCKPHKLFVAEKLTLVGCFSIALFVPILENLHIRSWSACYSMGCVNSVIREA